MQGRGTPGITLFLISISGLCRETIMSTFLDRGVPPYNKEKIKNQVQCRLIYDKYCDSGNMVYRMHDDLREYFDI